jgi:hypothetical protein
MSWSWSPRSLGDDDDASGGGVNGEEGHQTILEGEEEEGHRTILEGSERKTILER